MTVRLPILKASTIACVNVHAVVSTTNEPLDNYPVCYVCVA